MASFRQSRSPVNTFFRYYQKSSSTITMDLSDFKDTDSHLKMIKNTIIYAIILSIDSRKLKRIQIQANKSNQKLLHKKFLPLIHNQTRFFDVTISPTPIENKPYVLNNRWVHQIAKNINFSAEPIKEKLSEVYNSDISDLLLYRTVSESPLQIRYKGYQIGRWLSRYRKINPVNNPENIASIANWISWLVKERSNPLCKEYYDTKQEHYLESTLLENLHRNHIKIGKHTITKLFPNSEVFFQFPVLLKPGPSTKDCVNSAKYIDILAKSDNRPVVMELKVWGKATQNKKAVNSRGEYMFSAFSQVLSYCNYLVEIFGKQKKRDEPELQELYSLYWDKPIIYIIINDIGDDDIAKLFRDYIREIKKYIINADIYFVEFKQDPWDAQRKFEVKDII